jgi:hypothetical protein
MTEEVQFLGLPFVTFMYFFGFVKPSRINHHASSDGDVANVAFCFMPGALMTLVALAPHVENTIFESLPQN